VIYWRNKTLGT